jgi:hypothetical protein
VDRYTKPQKSAVRAIPYPVKSSFPWCQYSFINQPIQNFVPVLSVIYEDIDGENAENMSSVAIEVAMIEMDKVEDTETVQEVLMPEPQPGCLCDSSSPFLDAEAVIAADNPDQKIIADAVHQPGLETLIETDERTEPDAEPDAKEVAGDSIKCETDRNLTETLEVFPNETDKIETMQLLNPDDSIVIANNDIDQSWKPDPLLLAETDEPDEKFDSVHEGIDGGNTEENIPSDNDRPTPETLPQPLSYPEAVIAAITNRKIIADDDTTHQSGIETLIATDERTTEPDDADSLEVAGDSIKSETDQNLDETLDIPPHETDKIGRISIIPRMKSLIRKKTSMKWIKQGMTMLFNWPNLMTRLLR